MARTTKVIMETHRRGYSTDQITDTISVRELIDILSQFDEDAKIYTSHDNGYTFGGIHEDDFEEV